MEPKRKYEYTPVTVGDVPFDVQELAQQQQPRRSCYKHGLIVSVLLNVVVAILAIVSLCQTPAKVDSPLANTTPRPVPYRHFSSYSSESGNHSEVDYMWDQIKPYHGIVAVDTAWAKQQGLPPSQQAFVDPSKSHYVIDVYRQLHCLLYLRRSWYQLYDNDKSALDHTIDHYGHCFDAIRQSLMCSASDQLLHTYGDARSGNGDLRQCKNWSKLRDWATQHSACEANPSTERRKALCTKGIDGLLDTIV